MEKRAKKQSEIMDILRGVSRRVLYISVSEESEVTFLGTAARIFVTKTLKQRIIAFYLSSCYTLIPHPSSSLPHSRVPLIRTNPPGGFGVRQLKGLREHLALCLPKTMESSIYYFTNYLTIYILLPILLSMPPFRYIFFLFLLLLKNFNPNLFLPTPLENKKKNRNCQSIHIPIFMSLFSISKYYYLIKYIPSRK